MLRATRTNASGHRTAVHRRLDAARAHWQTQLDLIKRKGPAAWLTKCIRQTDNTIYHLCNHEWQWEREAGPYGERFNICKICGRTKRGATPRIPHDRLIPELKALLRNDDTPCEEHLFHESTAARMTNEALRSITNDGDISATTVCISCDWQYGNEPDTPLHPDEPLQQSRKRRRDEIPDEDQTESAVEKVMDTLAANDSMSQQKGVTLQPESVVGHPFPERLRLSIVLRTRRGLDADLEADRRGRDGRDPGIVRPLGTAHSVNHLCELRSKPVLLRQPGVATDWSRPVVESRVDSKPCDGLFALVVEYDVAICIGPVAQILTDGDRADLGTPQELQSTGPAQT